VGQPDQHFASQVWVWSKRVRLTRIATTTKKKKNNHVMLIKNMMLQFKSTPSGGNIEIDATTNGRHDEAKSL